MGNTVRPIYELSNIVSNGSFRTSAEEYRLWRNGFDIDKVFICCETTDCTAYILMQWWMNSNIYRFKNINLICANLRFALRFAAS